MSDAQIKQFSVADPRTFDGNPYEVAERAVAQAEAIGAIFAQSVDDAAVMARNAEMERQIVRDGEPDAQAFEDGPQGRKFKQTETEIKAINDRLVLLRRAAGFDPKAPLNRG